MLIITTANGCLDLHKLKEEASHLIVIHFMIGKYILLVILKFKTSLY